MTLKANGTDAKDIALHFVNVTTGRATPNIMKKTISQAKSLLEHNYSKEEIIKAIDYIIDVKKIEMYSFGYVNTCINDILREISKIESQEKAKEAKKIVEESFKTQVMPVKEVVDDESTQRNRNKLSRIGVQSRFGEELNFDMFEK